MPAILRLYEDVLSDSATLALAAMPRIIYGVHGAATIAGIALGGDEAWFGEAAVKLNASAAGCTCWRFELALRSCAGGVVQAHGVVSREKLAVPLETLPEGDLLLRGDSVAFPPGGCAFMHTHQGPGIRCLIEGGIRIDTQGHSTSYGPGGAWFESGPAPVFAQAADRPTRFIRVMILPRRLLGKSSIAYVNQDDKSRPKSQQYKIFVDAPVTAAAT